MEKRHVSVNESVMKYKHVFLIWLLADIFLATGLLLIVLWNILSGGDKDFDGLFFLVIAYGVVISMPSLLILTVFHFIYNRRKKDPTAYTKPYITVIICINTLYFLSTLYTRTLDAAFSWFYLCSTAAGLLAFYTVNRKIRKKNPLQHAE